MVQKGNLANFGSSNISETKEAMPTKIGVQVLHIHPYLYEFFWPNSNWLNFLTPMDYRGNLANFWSSNISETKEAMFTKIGVQVLHIHPYLYEFFWPNSNWLNFLTPMNYSPWSEREIWPNLEVAISPKPERLRPSKLVYMHCTSTPTCINFLSQF